MKKQHCKHSSLQRLVQKQSIKYGFLNGRSRDVSETTEYDEKQNIFIYKKSDTYDHLRNSMNTITDLLFFPVLHNLGDRGDKQFTAVLKIILSTLSYNLFALNSISIKTLYDIIFKICLSARSKICKQFAKTCLARFFEILTQRLKFSYITINKQSNPISLFYTSYAKSLITENAHQLTYLLVDKVASKIDENCGVQDIGKENVIQMTEIDFTPLTRDEETESGVFGFCVVCRKKADYYCKERRVPVCSFECKLKYSEQQESLKRQFQMSQQKLNEEQRIHTIYVKLLLELSNHCFSKQSEDQRYQYLSILLSIIRNPSPTLRSDLTFVHFLKTQLFPNILGMAIKNDSNILQINLIIFLNLVLNFRKYLKKEIEIFIRDVFMEILESANSKFIVKYYVLQVLTALIEENTIPYELFLNYDCSEEYYNVCEKIISLLVRIVQGKFQKDIYQSLISGEEEKQLRDEATQAIINLIQSTNKFITQNEVGPSEHYSTNLSEVISKKIKIDEAIAKLNTGKQKMIKQLCDMKIIKGEQPTDLAEFLYNDKRVSQFVIGEIFGDEKQFSQQVLTIYLEYLDFKGADILSALKHFLSLFELPGEGQKVERILEQFSKKYVQDNMNKYSNDAAYMLSFLLIMLHTNIHNPQVPEKMTLQKFLDIGKNINNEDQPIAVEELTGYFQSICTSPIAVHALERRNQKLQQTLAMSYKKKQELFQTEGIKLIENYSSKLRQGEDKFDDYKFVDSGIYIQIFINAMWPSLMAIFSTAIVNCEEEDQMLPCLATSCVQMITLCDKFNMQMERDSFVNLIVQFSGLDRTRKEPLKQKNLLFQQHALQIADSLRNQLHSGWMLVLDCIISLNFYISQAEGIIFSQGENPNLQLTLEQQNALFVHKHYQKEDKGKIFTDTKKLDEHSILDFISAICFLACKELDKKGDRYFYILEQIVVICYQNIYRNPLEWLRIWGVIDNFYGQISDKVINNEKNNIVDFSIDILRKLILCCFSNKHIVQNKYQKQILQVYVTICQGKNFRVDLAEYLLISLQDIIRKLNSQIGGGLQQLCLSLILCEAFSGEAGGEKASEVSQLILSIVMYLFDNIGEFSHFFTEELQQILSVILSLIKNKANTISIEADQLMQKLTKWLWEREKLEEAQKAILESFFTSFETFRLQAHNLCFQDFDLFYQAYVIKEYLYLLEPEQNSDIDKYFQKCKMVMQRINYFDNSISLETKLVQIKQVFQPIIQFISARLQTQKYSLEEYKHIFSFVSRQYFVTLLKHKENKALVQKYFDIISEQTSSRQKILLDQIIMNYNDCILECAQMQQGQWQDQVWEIMIEQICQQHKEHFPWEVISKAHKQSNLVKFRGLYPSPLYSKSHM